ncbi:head maturation protease, ClpP-related [Niallia sp. FSL W8-0951]|uniref:head maturation protease, ClpP-related n=1 Tax=Niallia sp. FSL W8-0951 TaxID=2954639 RepID=UPI0030FB9B16
MTTIEIKGVIVMNDYKEVYEWYGIECTSPSDVINQLPTDNSPVEIIINSGGGHVDAGNEIYARLKAYEGEVTTKPYSIAASAASIIAMAGDKVLIAPTAQLMIHNVSGLVDGDHRAHIEEAKVLEGYNKAIANAYILKTGKSEEEILQMMNNETWLNANEAVEKGFADGVLFENKIQYVASSYAILPNQAIDKARLMMKNQSSPPSVEGEVTKSDFEAFKNEITNLINQLKEEPTSTPPQVVTKRKGFLF